MRTRKASQTRHASHELAIFAVAGVLCGAISIFVMWWLSIVALWCGIRVLMMGRSAVMRRQPDALLYRTLAFAAIAVGAVGLGVAFTQ